MAGGPASAGWLYSLIDPKRPHVGVRVTAPTGENTFCPAGANRSFTVELQCAPVSIGATPPLFANVFETDGLCKYRMILQSIAGCPTACITNNGGGGGPASICSGNGVCGYDSDNQYSKCFCYAGSTGPGCGSAAAAASAVGVEGGLLIAGCLVLVLVIGMTVFMFLKLRKLQIDPAAYSELEGRFNELGMVA
jgi:hypothetical protein